MSLYTNSKSGYVYVNISKENKKHNLRVHKLVAEAFIDNPNNYKQINHIDGNRQNNKVDNLEWCNGSYNIRDMYKRNGKYDRDKDIIEKYKELKSCNMVAKLFKTTGENVRNVLIRNNVERYNLCGRKKLGWNKED